MRRALAWVAVVCVVAAGMVLLGRHERSTEQSYMLDRIANVRAAIGPSLTRPGPNNYVYDGALGCLLYADGGRSYALELCADPSGRIVEAWDRRGATTSVYSVAPDPGAARLRVAPSLFPSLIARVRREHPGYPGIP